MKTAVARLLFPYMCIFCSEATRRSIDLCDDCKNDLPWLDHVCMHCAAPLPMETDPGLSCGVCLRNPLPFQNTCLLFSYTGGAKKLITGLKFQGHLLYADILGTLLVEKIEQRYLGKHLPQSIIPVPLHQKRLRERGFNQSMEIARPISRQLGIHVDYKSCKRIRNTPAQSALPAKQRAANLKNAFAVRKPLPYRHVALLDDVMTTGHTLIELSRTLYEAGIERIDVWCCARTYLGSL